MGAKINTEKGFVDHYIEHSIDQGSFLAKVDRLLDWNPFVQYLALHLKRGPAAAGQPAYPDLVMFKMILLQFLYNLSDEAVTSAVADRISFLHFVGLSFDSSKPDASTVCRFRSKLLSQNHYSHLFELFNAQLEAHGLLVKTGVAVDATLITSSRRPRKVLDVKNVPHDRQEPGNDLETVDESTATPVEPIISEFSVSYSDDADATWTVKGKQPIYGYKAHVGSDLKHGFILGGHVTGANISDTKELEQLIQTLNLPGGAFVTADKGYASQSNRQMLKDNKLRDCIMQKAKRNKEMNVFQKKLNSMISKYRWKIERCFGTLKKIQGFSRARYLGCAKVEMEFYLQALAHNVRKAANLIS